MLIFTQDEVPVIFSTIIPNNSENYVVVVEIQVAFDKIKFVEDSNKNLVIQQRIRFMLNEIHDTFKGYDVNGLINKSDIPNIKLVPYVINDDIDEKYLTVTYLFD